MLSARGRLTVTDVWRRVRVLFEQGADHRGEDRARATCRRAKRPTSACSPRRRASPSASSSACRRPGHARGARGRGARRGALRAQRPERASPRRWQGPLAERLSEAELKYLWGVRRLRRRARAPRRRRSSGSRARATRRSTTPPRLEDSRRAARRRVAGGARVDRPHVRRRGAPAGVDLLVRARARGPGRGNGQPRLLPAHCRPGRLLRPARVRGARLRDGAARA